MKKSFFILLVCFLLLTNSTFAQNPQNDKEVIQAMEFVKKNRYIDALPLLEKVAVRYPNDVEIQTQLGIAILTNSVTIKDEALRKVEIVRASKVLKKARELGTENIVALHYLEKIEEGQDIGVAFNISNKEVEDAIREGEGFFGRGEYDKAFQAYQRAYKLDPKSYDAALFSGDCFYSQQKYKESEEWFAKAVAINSDREQAFRFWGDALANQGKGKESLSKYANAFIAEPSSSLTWESFLNAIKRFGNRKTSPFIVLPAEDKISNYNLVVDKTVLSSIDGTDNWNRFSETRQKQIEQFNKIANGRKFEPTIIEDVEALKNVAVGVKASVQKGVKVSKSMENIVTLEKLEMLDIYTILIIHGGDNCPEYIDFREKNRERMERFLVEYFAEIKAQEPTI
jgi:tetratricopeptide (TPR) repeat protein